MEEEIKLLLQEIANNPEDWDRYLILADAFEEANDERRAKGCRWAHKWKKRPYILITSLSSSTYHWYDIEETVIDNEIDPESDLPSDIFWELDAKEIRGTRWHKNWDTFQGAFLALLKTWVKNP